MIYFYTLSTGRRIGVTLPSSIMSVKSKTLSTVYVTFLSPTPYSFDSEYKTKLSAIRHNVYYDSQRAYICVESETVYLENYEFMPLDELISYINESLEAGRDFREDFVQATLLKETDKIGFLYPCQGQDFDVSKIGLKTAPDQVVEVLYVPERRYSETHWLINVNLIPENPALKAMVSSRIVSMQELITEIKSKKVMLVNKECYLYEMQIELFRQKCQAATFHDEMKNVQNQYKNDPEKMHIAMDCLLCETLRNLGFGAGIDIFENITKHYS